jgi:uncharacterized protein
MGRESAALILIAAALAGCSAKPPPEPPECRGVPALALTGRLMDAGNMLDGREMRGVTQALKQYEADTGRQMVTVTVANLSGLDVADYARCLGNRWSVGGTKRKDGVLLLLARDERRVRLATGDALRARLTDEEAQGIIKAATNQFRANDFGGGIQGAIRAAAREVGHADSGARP